LFIDHFTFPFFSLLGTAPFQYHENCKVNKLSCSALLKLKAALLDHLGFLKQIHVAIFSKNLLKGLSFRKNAGLLDYLHSWDSSNDWVFSLLYKSGFSCAIVVVEKPALISGGMAGNVGGDLT
jgi:hypothetical protein